MYISTRKFQKSAGFRSHQTGDGSGRRSVRARRDTGPLHRRDLSHAGSSYQGTAERIISLFLNDFTEEEIKGCIARAYRDDNFDHPQVAPLYRLNEQTFFLELWHGPTAAFKDIALQIMPHFLSLAVGKMGVKREMVILVATSGDTGKAALEWFKNVPGTKIIVFYPYNGVSKIQELQMTTTDGSNTSAIAVRGNFDNCQSAVKDIFADENFNQILAANGYELSSANSINWGRLLPQIVYYFRAYLDLLEQEEIAPGEKINLRNNRQFWQYPGRLVCAKDGPADYQTDLRLTKTRSPRIFRSGIYDRNREFKQTRSPSMDILISSNLERFLFEITGHDAENKPLDGGFEGDGTL